MAITLEERAKEIPEHIEKDTGMRKMYGYMKHNRYHVYVPTTIFDPKVAVIRVYEVADDHRPFVDIPEKIIGEDYIPLASMPTWNVAHQCLVLNERDEQKVSQALET